MPAVTVSMPADVLSYADQRAAADGVSRSAWLVRLVLTAQYAEEPGPNQRPVPAPTPAPVPPPRRDVAPHEVQERVPCPQCDNPVPPHFIGKPHRIYGRLCPGRADA